MPAAVVKDFDPMKGFGTLVLESGEELLFDIAIANVREPHPGDRVQVTVGVGWKGRPKATSVVFESAEDSSPLFDGGVEQLRAFGFLRAWDLAQARAAAGTLFGGVPVRLTRAQAGQLLRCFYVEGPGAQGRTDGTLAVGRTAAPPVADLCAMCREPVEVPADAASSLASVLAAVNAALAAQGSADRLFRLDGDAEFDLVACRPSDFESRIATTGWLAVG
jgi:cold shock CspA family protein